MGEDGEAYLEAEIEATGHRLAREHEQEQRREQFDRAKREMAATAEALKGLGLTLVQQKSEYHFHVLRIEPGRRTLVAQWWPSSGKTMDGERKGQRCTTGRQLVAWLRDKMSRPGRKVRHG